MPQTAGLIEFQQSRRHCSEQSRHCRRRRHSDCCSHRGCRSAGRARARCRDGRDSSSAGLCPAASLGCDSGWRYSWAGNPSSSHRREPCRLLSLCLTLPAAAGRQQLRPGFVLGLPRVTRVRPNPADPPTVDEIVAVMRQAGDDRHGHRLSAPDRRPLAGGTAHPGGAVAGRDRS
jgi:hypothetical protein